MNSTCYIIPLALVFLSISCEPGSPDPIELLNSTGNWSRGITGGDLPDASHHQAVVALLFNQGPFYYFFCSGTLISPEVVLTAGHCLQEGRGNPKKLSVFFGDTLSGASVSDLEPVIQTEIHPGYSTAPVSGFVNDIALIRLASPSSVTAVPALPDALAINDTSDPGTQVNFAGFGQDTVGSSGTGGSGEKLQVDSKIGGISNPCGSSGPCINDSTSQVWYIQNANQGGPCFGDSGGPMFINRDNNGASQWFVGGVTSYGDAYCAEYGVSTRPDAFECWIDNFITPGSCTGDSGGGSCGDGVIDPAEECDGSELGGASCVSLGFDGGTLACSGFCTFDSSQCTTTSSCTDGLPAGASCSSDGECCSGRCRGKPGSKTCKE